jgi:hypothetical protein
VDTRDGATLRVKNSRIPSVTENEVTNNEIHVPDEMLIHFVASELH